MSFVFLEFVCAWISASQGGLPISDTIMVLSGYFDSRNVDPEEGIKKLIRSLLVTDRILEIPTYLLFRRFTHSTMSYARSKTRYKNSDIDLVGEDGFNFFPRPRQHLEKVPTRYHHSYASVLNLEARMQV